jgi:putative ABC transport system permease protein
MDWRVLFFTASIALAASVLFGLIPALRASHADLNSDLKENTGRAGAGIRQNRARSFLVVGEMSAALLLLIGAALFIRTLIALRSVEPGFDPHNLVSTRTPLDPRFAEAPGIGPIMEDAFGRLRTLPGIEGAAFTRLLPLEGSGNSLPIVVAGRPLNGPSHGSSRWVVVSPGYFEVLRIPLVRGRSFTDADRLGAPGVAIINQAMAAQLWPEGDPLNDRIFIGKGLGPNFEEPARQIVGIVGDVHDNALGELPAPAVFVPGEQLPDTRWVGASVAWVIRVRAQSSSLDAAIQSELRQATGEPVPPLRSMQEILVKSTVRQDFNMLLMTFFGGCALLLAAIGIYGLMAYSVQQRMHEMGVRMALGAGPRDIQKMVVFQGMRLVLIGLAIGYAIAFGLTRFIASLLFGVKARDPLVFASMPVFLSAVALLAIWLPARRASRIDPLRALRNE